MTAIQPFDVDQTVLAQYANSPTLRGIVGDISEWLDDAGQFNTFYTYVWDILTAQGFGLDIWGRILGAGRVWPIADVKYFGFEEALPSPRPFNQGVFWTGSPLTTNYALTDEAYRRLLLAKAYANILDGGTYSINRLLQILFAGRGKAYVIDNNDMTMTYKFEFALTPVDLTLVQNAGVLPQPAGIDVNLDIP